MIEFWLIISTLCYCPGNIENGFVTSGKLISQHDAQYLRCCQQCVKTIEFSSIPVVAREGQEVKRICDFTGHKWEKISLVFNMKNGEKNILIDNLVTNSRKAYATELTVNLNESNGRIILDFIDNGIGINQKNIKTIFDFLQYSLNNASRLTCF
jgi:nitrogen fixation/metabolism regulation signal transduction histidine kinase